MLGILLLLLRFWDLGWEVLRFCSGVEGQVRSGQVNEYQYEILDNNQFYEAVRFEVTDF